MTIERDENGRFVKGGTKNPKSYTWEKGFTNRKGLTKENNESVKRQSVKISKILKRLYAEGKMVPRTENPKIRRDKHWNWKGNNINYGGLHDWIRKKHGTPSRCEECGMTKSKMFEWANITGKYNRDIKNYKRLCVKCHRVRDLGGKI